MSGKKSRRYMQQAEEIRNRLQGRPYTMGLDMGVGSIGLAIVALDREEDKLVPSDIVFTTSRIFSPSTGAADRRSARGQRNAIRHKANRLRFLWKLLAERGLMLPYSQESVLDPATLRFSEETRRKDPYALRLKGLSEPLELDEIGYAIYHIANHRGASSVRTFLDEPMDKEKQKEEERQKLTEEFANKQDLDTFVEVLAAFNKDRLMGYRNTARNKDKKVPLPTRDIIERELEKLLAFQASVHPQILDEHYRKRITEAVLYENEKIVPEAGYCPYFPDEKKLPKCHPLNEERRLWEALNNARVSVPVQMGKVVKWTTRSFSTEEKKSLFSHLRKGKDLTPSSVRDLLSRYENARIQLQGRDAKSQKIQGFRFRNLEEKPYWRRMDEEMQDNFLADWINIPDDHKLADRLKESYGFSESETKDALSDVKLIGDYAPIGKTAMKLVMKYIEDGASFTEAIELGMENGELRELAPQCEYEKLPYYGKALSGSTQAIMGKYWHSAFEEKRNLAGFHKPHTDKEEEQFGRIANPVVHQSLNELRKLVNEIIELLGEKPAEIVVEMGRELKLGAEKRDKISKEQGKREKAAQRIYETYCLPNNLPRRYIRHFRLLEEQDFCCPYCLKDISVEEVCGNRVDIDHILPREDTADDSEANKVVTHAQCNRDKGKRTPFSALGNSDRWTQIMHYLDNTPGMKRKRWRFEMDDAAYHKYLESKGFRSRFESDNSYVAKATMEYLRTLYGQNKKQTVRSLNGRDTALLRKAWGLQWIDEELGKRHVGKNKGQSDLKRKNRDDNRHHSLDAIVAAYCSRSFVKRIHDLSARGFNGEQILEQIPIPSVSGTGFKEGAPQRESFQKQVKCFLDLHGFISLKPDHDLNGTLVKGTVYSILGANPNGNELVFVVKKKVADIKVKEGTLEEVRSAINGRFTAKFARWYPEDLKQKILEIQQKNAEIVERYENSLTKARDLLEESNAHAVETGKKPIPIDNRTISKKALEICGGTYLLLSNNSRIKTFVAKEPTKGSKGFAYDTGNSLCLDLYHDRNGKLCGEIIRKVNAMDRRYSPRYKKEGYQLFERIYQGDILEIDAPSTTTMTDKPSGSALAASVRTPNALPGRTFVNIVTFTETSSGFQVFFSNLAKARNEQDASFTLGSIQKLHARKVMLSPAGLTTYVSSPLEDHKKED